MSAPDPERLIEEAEEQARYISKFWWARESDKGALELANETVPALCAALRVALVRVEVLEICDMTATAKQWEGAYLLEKKRAVAAEARAEEAENYAKEGWAWLDDALDALGVKTVFDIKDTKAREKT